MYNEPDVCIHINALIILKYINHITLQVIQIVIYVLDLLSRKPVHPHTWWRWKYCDY